LRGGGFNVGRVEMVVVAVSVMVRRCRTVFYRHGDVVAVSMSARRCGGGGSVDAAGGSGVSDGAAVWWWR